MNGQNKIWWPSWPIAAGATFGYVCWYVFCASKGKTLSGSIHISLEVSH
jgi:hypothetical protein